MEAYEHRARGTAGAGDLKGAASDVEAMGPLAVQLRQPAQDWFVAERRAVHALHEGRLADAEARGGEALRIGSEAMGWSAGLSRAPARRHPAVAGSPGRDRLSGGRCESMRPAIRFVGARISTFSRGRARRRGAGRPRRVAPDGFAVLDFDETWLASVAFLAEAVHAVGDPETPTASTSALRPTRPAWR